MKRVSIYATQMGILYRVPLRNWRNFLKVRSLQWASLDAYGTALGEVINVTDIDESEARALLASAPKAQSGNYGKTATYHCKQCGTPFKARVAERKRGWAIFCSPECKHKNASLSQRKD